MLHFWLKVSTLPYWFHERIWTKASNFLVLKTLKSIHFVTKVWKIYRWSSWFSFLLLEHCLYARVRSSISQTDQKSTQLVMHLFELFGFLWLSQSQYVVSLWLFEAKSNILWSCCYKNAQNNVKSSKNLIFLEFLASSITLIGNLYFILG